MLDLVNWKQKQLKILLTSQLKLNKFAVIISIAPIIVAIDLAILTQASLSQNSTTPEQPRSNKIKPNLESPPSTFSTFESIPRSKTPPPFNQQASDRFNEYRLASRDGITINVQRFPEFNFPGRIDPQGNILIPILGRVSLAGLTIEEVESKISNELFARFLRVPPKVNAILAAPRPTQITLLGEVVRPGFYIIPTGAPFNLVFNTAGGTTQRADLREIIVRRTLIDGTITERKVNLYQSLQNGQSLPNINLQGGDTIIVPKLKVGEDRDYDRILVSRSNLPQQTIVVRVLFPVDSGGRALRNLTIRNGSTFLDVVASLPSGDGFRIKTNRVALMRFDPEQGKVVSQILNPQAAIRGNLAENTPLNDGDVIVVSRTLLGEVFNAFRILTQPIRDVLGFQSVIDSLTNIDN